MHHSYFKPVWLPVTAAVHVKRYYDIDTGKFDSDRLEKILCDKWGDIIDDDPHGGNYWSRSNRPRSIAVQKGEDAQVFNFPKHVPRDDNFDVPVSHSVPKRELREEVEHTEHTAAQLAKTIEQEYQVQVRMAEARANEMNYHGIGGTNGGQRLQSFAYRIANKWSRG